MPKDSSLRHVLPDANDPADIPTAVARTAFTGPMGILDVSSRAQANAISAAYNDEAFAAGVDAGRLYVWRTDTNQLERQGPNGWEYVAGQQHAARIQWRREDLPQNPSTPLVLYGIQFLNATSAWSFNSAQNLVIPETGMYAVSFDANLTGAAGTAGRVFFQFSTTDGQVSHRISAANENNFGGGIEVWHLHKGQQMRVQVYHEGGGARTWSGVMTIAMVAATPDW